MEQPDLKNNWHRWKTEIKKEHPHLTDEDLHYEHGKEEELIKRLGERLKKKKEEIYYWLHMMG